MKLHLPLALRFALFALTTVCTTFVPAQAGIMHSDATLITYTDFGQNEGRYSVGVTNALLQHIRKQEGGVTITYTGGQTTYVMPHGMIDFGSNYHLATCAAISPSAVASCAHYYTFNSSFTGTIYGIGDSHAIQYKGIEIAEGQVGNPRWNSDKFSHCVGNAPTSASGNGTDHKVMRLSKVITDAPYVGLYDVGAKAAADSTFNLNNHTFYHAGSGQMWLSSYNTHTLINKDYPNNAEKLTGAHAYVIGGVVSGCTWYTGTVSGFNSYNGYKSPESFAADGINSSDPLTWVSRPGDSGSPLYVWDEDSGSYQYIGSNRGELLTGQVGSAFVVDTTFDKQVVEERYTKKVNMGAVSKVYLNAVSSQGETITDAKNNTTTKWLGTVTGEGMETVSFVGLKSELNTWSDLNGLKDTQAWYAYNQSYVAQSNADLFFTENLVFNASAKENRIVLNDTVDLGIGYAEFNGGEFTISSAEGESYLFNHAGYVINAGAEVHLQLTNPATYMREWRKIGAGDLYIEGSGNNDMLLNLGGSGKTYLSRTDGYAAYNVLVNTGATVVINDTKQIKRDLSFGNRGGTLDMNGNTMDWYTTSDADGRFTINALTEDALVANYRGSSTLTYKEAGDTTYAGSFADSDKSSLKVVYDVAKGSWTLNSIRTNLQHEGSGLQVDAGRVILSGTNTIHGTGSATGRDTTRYFHEDDWHYADARMKVRVTDGGTFELGSHARLTGDVTVESGGTYVMREGVRHALEYVEGGQVLEDTGKYAAYFGHKGDVVLNGGTFAVQFNDGVDATTAYNGAVKGTGAMTVDAGGDGGIFSFGGEVDATVSKTLNRGLLLLTGTAAADTTNKWLVNGDGAIIQFDNVYDTLEVIDNASTGVIALKSGLYQDGFDFSKSHRSLGIGAQAGAVVEYGSQDAKLAAVDREWRLGGGGGELQVHYKLTGDNALVAGSGETASGVLSLLNPDNDFTGNVSVQGIMLKMGLVQNQIELKKGHLNILDALSGTYEARNISGTGALSLNFTDAMETNELALHEGLSVDVHLQSGAVSYKKSTMSGNWELSGGVKLRLAENVALSQDLDLNVSGKAELHGDRGLTIGNGVLRGSGELVNALTGTVAIADMSELACFTQNSATGSAEIQGGHAQKVTVNQGSLSLAQSVTVNEVLVNGGNLYINANNTEQKRLSGDITITGGVLKFNSAGTSDTLNYDARGCSISVGNGTLDFGTTRQTMGGWTIVMSDGGVITGKGDATYGAMDFNQNNSTIHATDGESTISSVTRLRAAAQDINLNYDVAEGASLTVSGLIHADNNAQKRGSVTKKGKGTLVYGVQHTYAGTTTIEDGSLVLDSGAYELKNNVSGAGVLEIAGDTTCSINTGVVIGSNITVDSNASLIFKGSGYDSLGNVNRNLVVDGGSVAMGTTRQTMYSWNVYLSDGAEITGEGGKYGANNAFNAALDFNNNNSTIYVTSGTNTISAITRLRNGNNLNYDVSEGATLTVSGLIHADNVSGMGSITKLGEGTLVLSAANTYAGTTTVNSGVLRIAEGGSIGNSRLVLNGGTLEIAGSADNIFSASNKLKVESGQYSAFKAESMTISNDLLDVGAGSTLELQGGTYSLNGDLGTADSHLVVSSTGLTASGGHRSLSGLVEVTSDVAVTGRNRLDIAKGAELRLCDGASLTRDDQTSNEAAYWILGSLSTAENAKNVEFKSADDIHLNYNQTEGGSIDLAAGSELAVSVDKLTSYNSASINVGQNASLDLSGTTTLQLSSGTAVFLDSGAELRMKHLSFSNEASSGQAKLISSDGSAYALGTDKYELSDGRMTFDTTSAATIQMKLTRSSVENACGYKLTLNHADNSLTGLLATKGDIEVQNIAGLELEELEIAAEKTLTAAAVVVSELAKLEAGATLNADLVLASGATVELGGTMTLSGALNLQTGLTLSGTVLEAIQNLKVGESCTLFTGVEGLNLQQTITLFNMRSLAEQTEDAVTYEPFMGDSQVAAADYFSNLTGNSGLVLDYNSSTGAVSITYAAAVPEPATATLSLLALAGLCARRRRKS